jgi:hypothetical protein
LGNYVALICLVYHVHYGEKPGNINKHHENLSATYLSLVDCWLVWATSSLMFDEW